MSKLEHGGRVACLLLVAGAAQFWTVNRNPIPAQDAVSFVRYARQFDHHPALDVLRSNPQHPLYPFLVWCHHRLQHERATGTLSEPAVGAGASWVRSAQWTSAAAAMLLVVPMYLAGCRLGNPNLATLATGLFSLLPFTTRLGADALSDSTYLLFMLAAFWCATEYLSSRRALWLVGCGVASGLAYLARPEGLLFVAALAATIFVIQFHRTWRMSVPSLVRAATCLAVGLICAAGPYVLFTGKLTPKGSAILLPGGSHLVRHADQFDRKPLRVFHDGREVTRAAGALSMPASPELVYDVKHRTATERFSGYRAAFAELIRELVEGLHYIFGVLVFVGIARAARAPANVLASIVAIVFFAVLLQFAANAGYVASRHVLTIVCLACYVAARGGEWFSDVASQAIARLVARLSSDRREEERIAGVRPVVATAMIGFAALYCLGRHADGLHPSREAHVHAGRWLADHAARDSIVLDSRGWASLYSDLVSYDYHAARLAFEDPRLSFVVVEQSEVTDVAPRSQTLRRLLAIGGEKVVDFPAPGSESVIVYRWHHDRLLAAMSTDTTVPRAN